MKNKGVLVLTGLVIGLGLYAYFGEYKREMHETERKESDSKIVTLKRDQIWKVTLDKLANTKIVLEKGPDGWSLTQPLQDQADNETVDAFLDQMVAEKSKDIIGNEANTNWEEYGLQAPLGLITVESNAGEKESITVSQRKNFEGLVFLRKNQDLRVLTSSAVWSDFITRNVDFYRNLRIFRSQISKVDRILLQNTKGRIELKNKNASWESVQHPEWKMDQNAIRDLLTQVGMAKGTGLIETKPSGPPRMSLELNMRTDKWMGQFYKDSVMATPPNLHLRIEPQVLEKLPTLELISLRDKTIPFKFQRDLVQKIIAKSPLKAFSLVKKGGQWELEKQDQDVIVSSSAADDLIEKLHRLEVYKYLPTPEKNQDFPWEIQLLDEGQKTVFRLSWSDFKDHEALASTNLTPEVFKMDDAQINRLMLSEVVKPKLKTSPQDKQNPGVLDKKVGKEKSDLGAESIQETK